MLPPGPPTLGLIEEDHARPRDRRDAEDIPRAAASNFLSVTPSSKSKPIAIPLPPDRRQDPLCASASTPPAPLSARGDLPGGYFPLHEDPDSRLHIPHPFHVDASMARQQSLRRAAESSKSPTMPAMPIPIPTVRTQPPPPSLPSIPTTAPPPGRMTATAQQGMTAHSSPASSPSTPISSYIPSGLLHASAALPMGKYYPSNWEKRHGKAPLLASHQSEGNGIAKHHQNGHKGAGVGGGEGGGDATRRRLLQYQRDMVAQAAMSANAVIAAASSSSSPSPFALLRAHRPASPRLRPLGSPGPVTPMSLEGEGGVWEGVAASGSGDGLVRGGDVEKYEEGEDSDGETRARVKRRGHGQARELVGVASI
ncbi:hypothetical protein C8A05DRAFT_18230 [Staphylotrichum tortipilum]|uniref:Uncharacterized protein n=1 Tax=Staphylotrichum tortipilum TaxID=2831512 RepID=A0AAN6RQK4_9PEZI|nr:hypothetical protein C8A05DRAFT_18230 [Staphylotrichum longicolle]